jgi:hypothetical protein
MQSIVGRSLAVSGSVWQQPAQVPHSRRKWDQHSTSAHDSELTMKIRVQNTRSRRSGSRHNPGPAWRATWTQGQTTAKPAIASRVASQVAKRRSPAAIRAGTGCRDRLRARRGGRCDQLLSFRRARRPGSDPTRQGGWPDRGPHRRRFAMKRFAGGW